MTTNIILIGVLFIVNSALTVFLSLKCIQLGLRWQVEVRQERPPTMEIKNPIEAIQQVKQEKSEKEAENTFSEWLFGAKE